MISTQIPSKSMIKRIDVFYTLGEGVIVSADIESKSRPNLTHYTRLVIDPITMKVIKSSCDCEGYTFKHKCWHIRALEDLTSTELRNEIEKARNEMLREEEEIASWGKEEVELYKS
ncbi:SWIM zinc finger family protein [Sulfolobus tengchongensis]|uniref:SWIM zinc finger family protein n=1 Tax=Sulfolobus tengchongensis TaxID=207809 RepID=A0AAX4L5H4_9CREN